MKPTEIAEDLDDWARAATPGVPAPITEWHHSNARYVVDGVPFTKPQVEAFILGLEKGYGWVKKIAEYVGHQPPEATS